MNITIANISTVIGDAELQATVAAIEKQVTQHFQPEWGLAATLTGKEISLTGGKAPIDNDQDAIIYLGDSWQDPTTGVSGALGYHSVNHGNIPYGFIYLDICAEYDEVWSVTLDHEVLELLADPDAVMTVTGPAPGGAPGNVYYDFEVADPTQGDSYTIDGVEVSNFVGRSYFGMSGGSGTTNYLNLPLAAFGVRPGGYFQYEDATGSHQILGRRVTSRQRAAKQLIEDGRRNPRRARRIHRSLRMVLAADPDLRRRVQQAAALAAYSALKDAGVAITPDDVVEAKLDLAAIATPLERVKADTAGDIIDGVGTAAGIAIALGF